MTLIRTLARGDAIQTEAVEARFEWATGARVPVYVAAYGPRRRSSSPAASATA